jgi:hypothetical protein
MLQSRVELYAPLVQLNLHSSYNEKPAMSGAFEKKTYVLEELYERRDQLYKETYMINCVSTHVLKSNCNLPPPLPSQIFQLCDFTPTISN